MQLTGDVLTGLALGIVSIDEFTTVVFFVGMLAKPTQSPKFLSRGHQV